MVEKCEHGFEGRCLRCEENKQGVSVSTSNDGFVMPLFSKRNKIADLCEKWCRDNDVPMYPVNIITAALRLGLLQIKTHD